MENYAYEKRALVQVESKKVHNTNMKSIGIVVVILAFVACACIFLKSKESSRSMASSKIPSEINFNNDYNSYTYKYNDIEADFGRVNFVNGNKRLFIKEEALCIQYPRGGEGVNNSGAQINITLRDKGEYYMEYEICFDGNGNNFDWQEGGMLSGLIGGSSYNGTQKNPKSEGFKAMLIYNNYGYLYPCVQLANDAESGGKIYQQIGRVVEGKWTKVKMYVKINDKGKSNGIFKVWLDDKLSFNNDKIRYMTGGTKINACNVQAYSNSTDNGGGAKHEEFVYLDNIKIY